MWFKNSNVVEPNSIFKNPNIVQYISWAMRYPITLSTYTTLNQMQIIFANVEPCRILPPSHF